MVSFIRNVLDPISPGPDAPFGEHRVRFGDLAWATAAVSSRAFTRLYGSGWVQESRPLLVPFMDMLNFTFDQENVKVKWRSYAYACACACACTRVSVVMAVGGEKQQTLAPVRCLLSSRRFAALVFG